MTCDGCNAQIDLTHDERWASVEYGAVLYEGDRVLSAVRVGAFVCETCYADGQWSRDVLVP